MGRIGSAVATLGLSEVVRAVTPKPDTDVINVDRGNNRGDIRLTEEQEDQARATEAEAERRKRRRARLRRVFTGPQGALVSEANLGRPRLFGQ